MRPLIPLLVAVCCVTLAPPVVNAQQLSLPFAALQEAGLDVKADHFEFVGDNMVVEGNIMVRYQEMLLYADKAVLNNVTKDVELGGNIYFYQVVKESRQIEYWELEKLEKDPDVKVKVNGTVMSRSGRQMLDTVVEREQMMWKGENAEGNFTTGIFRLGNYASRFGVWHVLGKSAERRGDGKIVVKDATVSTCDALLEDHEVYSIKSSRIVGIPPGRGDQFNGEGIKPDDGNEYSLYAYNNTIYVGDYPVFWLPILYKPGRGDKGVWNVRAGYDSNWGVFVNTTNSWRLSKEPALETTNMLDFYSSRGIGYGNQTEMTTEETKSKLFMYGISDWNPEKDLDANSRWDIDPWRYDLDLSHMSHLTSKLDLRARLAAVSDINFFDDFFANKAGNEPEPPSFADLEYQFKHFTLTLAAHPRVNTWATTAEQLPELRADFQRQELFSNVYYQGQTSAGYDRMRWREFSKPRTTGNLVDPADYESGRFDSVNFLYYPTKYEWLNIIPRAGMRLTYYNRSSDTPVSYDDLKKMLAVDIPDGESNEDIYNYDDKGGGKFRFIGEGGLNLNTKLTRSYDYKNAYFNFDGIRHVMVPYIDYTLLAPTLSRDKLYYFDDIDRIDTQNFVRLGWENRLQTRRGSYKKPQIYTWATLENYFDVNFMPHNGQQVPGDVGTILKFYPHEQLKIDAKVLVDSGNFLVNKSSLGAEWEFVKDWSVFGRYNFSQQGGTPANYSMGSSMTQIIAGSQFERYSYASNNVNIGFTYKINDRTKGAVEATQDFQNGLFREGKIKLIRELPCHFQAVLEYALRRRRDNQGTGIQNDQAVMLSLTLASTPGYAINPRKSDVPADLERKTDN